MLDLGHTGEMPETQGEASRLINELNKQRLSVKPPTEAQISYLKDLLQAAGKKYTARYKKMSALEVSEAIKELKRSVPEGLPTPRQISTLQKLLAVQGQTLTREQILEICPSRRSISRYIEEVREDIASQFRH